MQAALGFMLILIGVIIGCVFALYLMDAAGWLGSGLGGPLLVGTYHSEDSASAFALVGGFAALTTLAGGYLVFSASKLNEAES